jgi:hypothetical protein
MYKLIKTRTATGTTNITWFESTEAGRYKLIGKKQSSKPIKQEKIIFYYKKLSTIHSIINKV